MYYHNIIIKFSSYSLKSPQNIGQSCLKLTFESESQMGLRLFLWILSFSGSEDFLAISLYSTVSWTSKVVLLRFFHYGKTKPIFYLL